MDGSTTRRLRASWWHPASKKWRGVVVYMDSHCYCIEFNLAFLCIMVVELSQYSGGQIKLFKSYIDSYRRLRREDRLLVFTFNLLVSLHSSYTVLYNYIHAPAPYMPFPTYTPICIHPSTVSSPEIPSPKRGIPPAIHCTCNLSHFSISRLISDAPPNPAHRLLKLLNLLA